MCRRARRRRRPIGHGRPGSEAIIADEAGTHGAVLLFDMCVVVLLPGPAPSEGDGVAPTVRGAVVVDGLRAVVTVQPSRGMGSCARARWIAAPTRSWPLPQTASSSIQAVAISTATGCRDRSLRSAATVSDQIDLQEAWLTSFHWQRCEGIAPLSQLPARVVARPRAGRWARAGARSRPSVAALAWRTSLSTAGAAPVRHIGRGDRAARARRAASGGGRCGRPPPTGPRPRGRPRGRIGGAAAARIARRDPRRAAQEADAALRCSFVTATIHPAARVCPPGGSAVDTVPLAAGRLRRLRASQASSWGGRSVTVTFDLRPPLR